MTTNRKRMIRMRRSTACVGTLVLLLSVVACNAGEDGERAVSGTELLTYDGPDREERLLECARKEPAMRLYTTHTSVDVVVKAFMEDYPDLTPVEVFSAVDPLPQVILEERAAGVRSFDVYSDATFNFNRTEELFARFYTPRFNEVRESVRSPLFVANKGFAYSAGYNPDRVSPSEVPTSYADFAKPHWKGRVGMGTTYLDRAVLAMLHHEFGEEVVAQIAQNVTVQDTTPRAVSEQIIAGEYDAGLTIMSTHSAIAAAKGAPLRWLPLEPVFLEYTVNAISNEAKAPCTAALWVDWDLAEDGGQAVYRELGNADPFEGGVIIDLDYLPDDFADDLRLISPDSPELLGEFEDYTAAQAQWERLMDEFARM